MKNLNSLQDLDDNQGKMWVVNRVKKMRASKAEIFLVLLLLTIGIPMILLIPPGAGYDEEDHLVRVWELSAFSFIPGRIPPQEMKYPRIFRDFAYRQQAGAGILSTEFRQRYVGASLYKNGYVSREINTKSVYSPALLLPQAIIMRYVGRKADLPALPVFYLCRFAGLLSYILLTWLAIRLTPFGEWILLVLAASPMALFLAATISADAISNGIGFLFIAGCLRVAEFKEIGWKESGILVLLIFLLFLAKLNLVPLVLSPFLLIAPAQYAKRWTYFLLLAIAVILFLVEAVGWNLIASRDLDAVLSNEASPATQLGYVLRHPLDFLQTAIKDLITNGSLYFQGWINGYGYYYWGPPQLVSLFFLLSLGSAVLINPVSNEVNRKFVIISMLIFVIGYLTTVASLYLSFTPVGADKVLGMQGRYFIPLAVPFFLALSISLSGINKIPAPSPKWMNGFLITALTLNIVGIWLAFYVPCGTTFYRTGLCYQPLYKDFTSEAHISRPASSNTSLTQEIRVGCNGLAGLRVLLFPPASDSKGTTQFVLQDLLDSRSLMQISISNDLIDAETWYPLNFDPDWGSAGRQYTLKVLGRDTPAGQGLGFLYSPQPEFDLGNLYENGGSLQEDVVLQYGCTTGLRKIWLTGKP